MNDSITVLIVDDDLSIVELLKDFFEHEQFRVITACNATEAWDALQHCAIQCIVLDIMMPGQNGFDLCRQIRKESSVPILFLSAKSDDVDKIRGLSLGGDDYIVKTASPGEIVARVKAVLRRTSSPPQTTVESLLENGHLQLNLVSREVFVEGNKVMFTPKEYELLLLFTQHPKQVFTYDQLLDKYWAGIGDRHTVRVHVSRLREKIEIDPANPQYLVNVWGVGYRYEGGSRENVKDS